ncbi:hypothetical protein BHE74_00049659 [Ensete ventricosum]|nr:hypothetical protein BHE74_00049659 [Ensete ventricosum]
MLPSCRCYFQPIATPTPFSLSTPYRPASSYVGSVIISTLTPCCCPHLLSIASVFSHSHTSALLPCKHLLIGHPYPTTATSLNIFIFLPHCHCFPLSSRVATSIVVAALILSPPHQHVALFLSSSVVIIPAIAVSPHCCPTALALPSSPATCRRYLATAISLQSCPATLSTILSNATTHGTPQPLFIAHRLSRCHLPLISMPALLLNNCYNPYTTISRFLLNCCFMLPFSSFVQHSLTLLFITHCSSITAYMTLSASPYDTHVATVSSLLWHSLSMPLLLLYRQHLISASPALRCNLLATLITIVPATLPHRCRQLAEEHYRIWLWLGASQEDELEFS